MTGKEDTREDEMDLEEEGDVRSGGGRRAGLLWTTTLATWGWIVREWAVD